MYTHFITYLLFKETQTNIESIFFYQPIDGKRVQLNSILFSLVLRTTRLFFTKKAEKRTVFYLHHQIPFQLTCAFQLKLIFALEK